MRPPGARPHRAITIGEARADRVRQVFTWHANVADNRIEKFASDYGKRYNEGFFYNAAKTELEMASPPRIASSTGH